MPRPTTKTELLKASDENFAKLQVIVDSFTPEQMIGQFPFDDRDRNVRDVLAHLTAWHDLLLNWEKSNMAGNAAPFLRGGYNWKTCPAMNIEIWREYQDVDLETVRKRLAKSHGAVQKMIAKYSDEELFTKKFYLWTGTSSLGAYCVSATASHYDWAVKKLRKYRKAIDE